MKRHRGKVQLSKGGYAPTRHTQWQRSQEKISLARVAAHRMSKAKDRVTFEREWNEFVDALEEAWNRFYEEGKRLSSKFPPWAGKYIKIRKKDPLLSYLINARHKSQHVLLSMDWEQNYIQLKTSEDGPMAFRNLVVYENMEFDAEYESPIPDNHPVIELKSGQPKLPTIHNRNKVYLPQKTEDEELKEKLQAILPLARKIEEYEKSFIKRINESKVGRGERVTALSENEKDEISEYDRDAMQITKEVCDSLQQLKNVREIIRILRSTLNSEIKRRKIQLEYYHPAERYIGEEGIALYKELLKYFDDILAYTSEIKS